MLAGVSRVTLQLVCGQVVMGRCVHRLERVKGIEPSYEAWEAAVLPLNYTRIAQLALIIKVNRLWPAPFMTSVVTRVYGLK